MTAETETPSPPTLHDRLAQREQSSRVRYVELLQIVTEDEPEDALLDELTACAAASGVAPAQVREDLETVATIRDLQERVAPAESARVTTEFRRSLTRRRNFERKIREAQVKAEAELAHLRRRYLNAEARAVVLHDNQEKLRSMLIEHGARLMPDMPIPEYVPVLSPPCEEEPETEADGQHGETFADKVRLRTLQDTVKGQALPDEDFGPGGVPIKAPPRRDGRNADELPSLPTPASVAQERRDAAHWAGEDVDHDDWDFPAETGAHDAADEDEYVNPGGDEY